MVSVIAWSSLAPREVKDTVLLYELTFCWKRAVLSVQTTFPLALTRVSVRRTRIGSGGSLVIGNMTAPLEQHIENFGSFRVDFWTPSSFQWKALQWGQLNVRNDGQRRGYVIFMGPDAWATFIKGSSGWCASKCCWAGNHIFGHGGSGAAAVVMGLRLSLCGDSVRTLLTFRSSPWRRIRGVVGGCVCSVGGVVDDIKLLRNLCNMHKLYLRDDKERKIPNSEVVS